LAQRAALEVGDETRDGISVAERVDGTRQVRRHRDDPRPRECLREIAITQPVACEAMRQHGHAHRTGILRTIDIDLDVLAAERCRFRHHEERGRLRDGDAGADHAGCERDAAKKAHLQKNGAEAKGVDASV
jgi:hypothetical protein